MLNAVPVAALAGPTARGAYVEATESIESDYELGRTLARVLCRPDRQNPEVTKALLQRASTMESDHELAELLLGLVATGHGHRVTRAVIYIDGIPNIDSDYEKQRVLTAIAPAIAGKPRLLAQSLRTAATIESDHSLSEYLKQCPLGHAALGRPDRAVLRCGSHDRVGLQPAGSAGCGAGPELRSRGGDAGDQRDPSGSSRIIRRPRS